jgi:ferredoxin-NADP reductase
MTTDPREFFSLTLISAQMITASVRHLVFMRADNTPFPFIPGQFITFHFEVDGVALQRSYSIASIEGKTAAIEIAISPFVGGPGTKFLFSMQPGDTVMTSGPFGRLVLRDEQPARYILVATGTGVTPYRAMLPELARRTRETDLKVIILQGVQAPTDLLYGADFLAYAKENPRLEFHAYYSRGLPEQPAAYEHQGYVQTSFETFNPNPEQDIFYLCGNPQMIDDAFTLLREKGFQTNSVRREKYISPHPSKGVVPG